jgi:hypothetical protein
MRYVAFRELATVGYRLRLSLQIAHPFICAISQWRASSSRLCRIGALAFWDDARFGPERFSLSLPRLPPREHWLWQSQEATKDYLIRA